MRRALDAEVARYRALGRRPWPIVPELPTIYFGYHSKENIPCEVTSELIERAAKGLTGPWNRKSLMQLADGVKGLAVADATAFQELNEEAKANRLRTCFESALVAPTAPGNNTRMWLLPQELSRNVYATNRIFEFFGDLIGVNVSNPARQLVPQKVPNPALELSDTAGFDLRQDLATLAATREGDEAWTSVEERLLGLIPKMRQRLGTLVRISDQILLDAICRLTSTRRQPYRSHIGAETQAEL